MVKKGKKLFCFFFLSILILLLQHSDGLTKGGTWCKKKRGPFIKIFNDNKKKKSSLVQNKVKTFLFK